LTLRLPVFTCFTSDPETPLDFDRTTNKMIEYDLQGHLLYTWGSMGSSPGYLWCTWLSVDQEGNLTSREVDAGRIQKSRESGSPIPAFLLAKPVYRPGSSNET